MLVSFARGSGMNGPEMRRTSIHERYQIVELQEYNHISNVTISIQLCIHVSTMKDV